MHFSQDQRLFLMKTDPSGIQIPVLYDYEVLVKLSYSNKEFEKRLLHIFIETVPVSIAKLKSAFEQKDLALLKATAHKLKTTVHSMGIQQLQEPVLALENTGHDALENPETVYAVAQVYTTLDAIVQEFKLRLT